MAVSARATARRLPEPAENPELRNAGPGRGPARLYRLLDGERRTARACRRRAAHPRKPGTPGFLVGATPRSHGPDLRAPRAGAARGRRRAQGDPRPPGAPRVDPPQRSGTYRG